MIYVYDIILNWTDDNKVYEFFEWELNDDLEHIKRIPLFKVKRKILDDILNFDVVVDKVFLEKITNLTQSYINSKVEKIKYASILTDGTRVVAAEFDDDGKVIYRSRMLLDEEQDVIILSNKLFEHNINIKKLKKRNYDIFSTRLESEIKKILTIEINDSYKKKNFDKLKYLYYECFGTKQEDIDTVYKKLLESITNEINYKHNKLYEVVKLSYQNKN